jgi:Domain of unknown function (DUF4365)
MPLPREHLLDELATAYVQAVAAYAGVTIAISRADYGIDGTLHHIVRARREKSPGYKFIPEGFPVEFQLKGTTVALFRDDRVMYDLSVRNYNLIVERPTVAVPLFLFLVCFASDENNWIDLNDDQLVLKASAFWWKQSAEPTKNTSTIRIEMPITSRLTSSAIQDMIKTSRDRFDVP